jgi:hypothetical protein
LSSVSVLESNELLLRECCEETKDILQLRSLEGGVLSLAPVQPSAQQLVQRE